MTNVTPLGTILLNKGYDMDLCGLSVNPLPLTDPHGLRMTPNLFTKICKSKYEMKYCLLFHTFPEYLWYCL